MFPFTHDNGFLIFLFLLLLGGVGILIFFSAKKILKMAQKFPKNIFSLNSNFFLLKKFFLVLSLIFLFLGILRPQWGISESKTEAKGADIVFALDISQSMNALDFQVQGRVTNRLLMSKLMIQKFVEEYPENRFSLVVFAGEAFTVCPLTLDHEAFLTFLHGVSPDDAKTPGTNLENALNTSLNRFSQNEEEERGKLLVLMSDGEEMKGNFGDVTEVAKMEGIPIVTVGIGSEEGSLIPVGSDMFGNPVYKKYKGELVKTRLNEEPLKKVAEESDGKYFHPETAEEFLEIHLETEDLQKTVLKKSSTEKGEKFQYFLLVSFLFFLLGFFFPMNFKNIFFLEKK